MRDRPKLTGIVAMTPQRVIGRDNALPWHLPADLAFFKRTTTGHPILMGRTTYDSIGRPLPKRRNLVLTRDRGWKAEGVEVLHDLDAVRRLDPALEIFVIGGAQVYAALLDELDELLITHVRAEHRGDTVFPPYAHLFDEGDVLESHDDFEIRRHLRKPRA